MRTPFSARRVMTAGVLAGVLAVGCMPPAQASAPHKTVTIKFWAHVFDPMNKYNKVLAKQYEKLHPGVKIQLQTFNFADFFTKLQTSVAGGSGPDVFDLFDPLFPQFVKAGLLSPVNLKTFHFKSYAKMKRSWLPNSLSGFESGGRVYGIPMEFDAFALYINTQAYQKAGLDPVKDAPTTWDKLMSNAKKLTIKKGGKIVQEGFDWGYPNPFWMTLEFYQPLLQEGGNYINSSGTQATINSAAGVKALTLFRDAIQKNGNGDPALGVSSDATPNADFASGEVAQWFSGPWAVPSLAGQPVDGHYKVVGVPQVDAAHPTNAIYSLGWVVNKRSSIQKEAWGFVNFLSRQQKGWLKNAGYIQPCVGYFNTPLAKTTPNLPAWVKTYKYGHYLPRNIHMLEIANAVKDMIDRVVKGSTDPKSSADQAQTAINDILSG